MSGKGINRELMRTYYAAMAEDIGSEKKRIGGDWAIAHVILTKEIREKMRTGSREVSPSATEKWEKEEEKGKEREKKMSKEQPMAAEVDTAARKGDVARVKQLQQLETSGIDYIIIARLSISRIKS